MQLKNQKLTNLSELPVHAHPVIKAGVLFSGELTVITEDRQCLQFKAGEVIVEVVDTCQA